MRLRELDYDLPEALIAGEPLPQRDQARVLVLERATRRIEHSRFYKLPRHLREGDLLVLNNTRVLPARLIARKESGGEVELLMVRPADAPAGAWLALARSHRPLREGARLLLDNGHALVVLGYQRPGRPLIASADSAPIEELLRENGRLALPHYIRRAVTAADSSDYQTIYRRAAGRRRRAHRRPALQRRNCSKS